MIKKYNLAVIGGGPAGMIAAGRAGTNGFGVVLLEKNDRLGVKLLITGKGRCNITNAQENLRKMIEVYGKNGKFLFSAYNYFSNSDVIDFFEERDVKTKVERGGRVFPVSDKSIDVLNCLIKYLKQGKVQVKTKAKVKKIILKEKKIEKIILTNNQEIIADNYLIATGGKSYPVTGSTGDAYKWLQELGHTIVTPKGVLTPIIVKQDFVNRLEGLSLKNVEISLWGKKKIASKFGEAIFTANGLSGPIILDLSKIMRESKEKDMKINIDFKPALEQSVLDKRLLKDFEEFKNKKFKNSLDKLLPKKIIPIIVELSGVDGAKKVCDITKRERKKIVKLLKQFELSYEKNAGFEKAIITAGGVSINEIDPKTMKSKKIDNLYLAGEIIDLDGPTGGYNLQVAWSTGYLAGDNMFT